MQPSGLVYLNGSTDYAELFLWTSPGGYTGYAVWSYFHAEGVNVGGPTGATGAAGGNAAVRGAEQSRRGRGLLGWILDDVLAAARPHGRGAQYMQIGYTPPVNAWWEVTGNMAIVQKLDAAYSYAYGGITISPADADGYATAQQLITQHSSVQQFESRHVSRLFKLTAGVPYTATLFISPAAGTWSYYCGPNHLFIHLKAWQR